MKIIKAITFPFWVIPLAVWEICKNSNSVTFAVNPGWHKIDNKYHHYNGFYLNGKRLTPKEMYEYESKLLTNNPKS